MTEGIFDAVMNIPPYSMVNMNVQERSPMKDPEEEVPPPDDDMQQEEAEQEPDEIPEDIPSSGLDAILDPNDETNTMWREYVDKPKTPLPVFDGFIAVELSAEPIPFHFVRTDAVEWDPQQAHAMAMNSARIACDSADIFRGRAKPARIERRMTPACLRRLENASQLLVDHMRRDARLHARIGILPVIMGSISGWLVNPRKFDCVVMLRIGAERMCCNMVFERMGTVWKCSYSDIG
ncbi:hypothetical protein [Bifidobacterium moukalabense]|uniref:hypothetical protein n=1 Tax=Bifidobacterium moukalabense TaxID=1333651 RepID=UPI001F3FC049|nr:hypothetical protein [Bifidobacterium moukalabense]